MTAPGVNPDIPPPPPVAAKVLNDSGTFMQITWGGWFRQLYNRLNATFNQGYTGTVALAKLTAGGSNGSLTVTNGIITNYAAPT